MPDTGYEGKVFTIYNGVFKITPKNNVIYSSVNILLTASLLCTLPREIIIPEYKDNIIIGVMPEECRPTKPVTIIIPNDKFTLNFYFTINPNGEIVVKQCKIVDRLYANGEIGYFVTSGEVKLHTNGICFSINNNYYEEVQ